MEAHVVTFTLCREHQVYYTQACPHCYLGFLQRQERQTKERQDIDAGDLAQLAATSTPWPMVP